MFDLEKPNCLGTNVPYKRLENIALNINVFFNKLNCTEYVDFGKSQDRF